MNSITFVNIDTTTFDTKAQSLPIVIEGHTFKPNDEGLWSLTEINKALPDLAKPPAQWRGRERDYFDSCANLHSSNGNGTWATERATIAYAMACSLDFYVMVVDAFVAMRNDAILSARMSSLALVEKDKQLADNMPKATALMLKAAGLGISWMDACRASNIKNAKLAKEFFLSTGRFTKSKPNSMETLKSPRPVPKAFSLGFFKRDEGRFGNADGWRVTDKGVVWLQGKADEVNEWVRERNGKIAKARHGKQKATRAKVVR